jgi:hypothetical protein
MIVSFARTRSRPRVQKSTLPCSRRSSAVFPPWRSSSKQFKAGPPLATLASE